jgi:D-alanyl-D-alanine carboxypeptidase
VTGTTRGKVFGLLTVAVLVASCSSNAAKPSASGSRSPSSTLSTLVFPKVQSQTILDQLVRASAAPGAIMAVSVHGGPATVLASGVSDPKTSAPMKPTDEMAVASNTKTFVGALVLLLVRDGKVKLDSPINDYGVDFPKGDVITVRELLSHTSGIPPLGGDGNSTLYAVEWQKKQLADLAHHFTVPELIGYVRHRPLLFAPGSSTSYSNINFDLAAQIVEHVTGKTWTEELHERLLGPLRLSSTYDAANETPPVPPVPGLFMLDGDQSHTVLNSGDFNHTAVLTGLGPAGSMVSNATDMVTWGNALLRSGAVLGPKLSAVAHKIAPGGTGLAVLGFDAGFCAFDHCPTGSKFLAFGAAGAISGAQTLLVYDTRTDSVVVLFANRTPADLQTFAISELALIARAEQGVH